MMMLGASQCGGHGMLDCGWGSGHWGAFAEGHLLACASTSGVCPVPQASSSMVLQSVSVWSRQVVVLAQ